MLDAAPDKGDENNFVKSPTSDQEDQQKDDTTGLPPVTEGNQEALESDKDRHTSGYLGSESRQSEMTLMKEEEIFASAPIKESLR